MNRQQAFGRIRKILGKDFAYRENNAALVGEDRDAALQLSRDAAALADSVSAALTARRVEVLKADSEYQRLRAACVDVTAKAERLRGLAHAHRLTVGKANSLFFEVKAVGDNWQEVVDVLTSKVTP